MNEIFIIAVIVSVSFVIYFLVKRINPEKRAIIKVVCGLAFLTWLILDNEMKLPLIGIVTVLVAFGIREDFKEIRNKKQETL
jgi:hypothetical protein